MSGSKISPTIAGPRTFDVTNRPDRIRERMNCGVVCAVAANTAAAVKKTLQTLRTGYRPNVSERGAMRRGPAASPSSQIVTSSTLAYLFFSPLERSWTILPAIGTGEMQVKVLHESDQQGEWMEWKSSRGGNASMHADRAKCNWALTLWHP